MQPIRTQGIQLPATAMNQQLNRSSRGSVGRKPVGAIQQVQHQPAQVQQHGQVYQQMPMHHQQQQVQHVQTQQGVAYQQAVTNQPMQGQQPVQPYQQGQAQQHAHSYQHLQGHSHIPIHQYAQHQHQPQSQIQHVQHQPQAQVQPQQPAQIQQQGQIQQPMQGYQQVPAQQQIQVQQQVPAQQQIQVQQQVPAQQQIQVQQQVPVQQSVQSYQQVQQPKQLVMQQPVNMQQQVQMQRPVQIQQQVPMKSNHTSQAINQQGVSSAASVRSVGSGGSSHTTPSQVVHTPQASVIGYSTNCNLCKADVSQDGAHLECLACSAAQMITLFCTNCCVSRAAITTHHHHMSNFVSVSDIVVFDPTVSVHGWDVRKSALGITWYHHKGSKIKTFDIPKPPIPVAQPHVSTSGGNFPRGWEEIKDPDGRPFFYHRSTKTSTWNRPTSNDLPPGWKECMNPDGRTYYLNTSTQAMTWDRPTHSSPLVDDDDDGKSIRSVRSSLVDTRNWSPGGSMQMTSSPQDQSSLRGPFVDTADWSPSDPTHRPIPTREGPNGPSEWKYDQYGNRRKSRGFSVDSLSNLRVSETSAAAAKAVVKTTKVAAGATAKGAKVVGKTLKNNKQARRIVAGVGMAAINGVLMETTGISLGNGLVKLVDVVDFGGGDNGGDSVADVSQNVDGGDGDGGDDGVEAQDDFNGDTVAADDNTILEEDDIVESPQTENGDITVQQGGVSIVPMGPSPIIQQQQRVRPNSTFGVPGQPRAKAQARVVGQGKQPVSSEWTELKGMQRPASDTHSHIPIHIPGSTNHNVPPGNAAGVAGAAGAGRKPGQAQQPGKNPGAASPQKPGQAQAPQKVNTVPGNQNQRPIRRPAPAQGQPQKPSQGQRPPAQQGASQPQKLNPQHNANQPQRPQPKLKPQPLRPNQNQGSAQRLRPNQNQNPGLAQRPPDNVQNSGPVKPGSLFPKPTPQQQAKLMKAGLKIGSSLLKSAIKSSMGGDDDSNESDPDDDQNDYGGGGDDQDGNDMSVDQDSYDFGDGQDNNVSPQADFGNDEENGFSADGTFDDGTEGLDTQDQGQDEYADEDIDADAGYSYDTETAADGEYVNVGDDAYVEYDDIEDETGDRDVYDDGTEATDQTGNQLQADAAAYGIGYTASMATDGTTDVVYAQSADVYQQPNGTVAVNVEGVAVLGGKATVFSETDTYNPQTGVYEQGGVETYGPQSGDYNQAGASTLDTQASVHGRSTADTFIGQNSTYAQAGVDAYSTRGDVYDQTLDPQAQSVIFDDNVSVAGTSWTDTTTTTNANATTNLWIDGWGTNVPPTTNTTNMSNTANNSSSKPYSGLTSASVSGPMMDYDYYNSFPTLDSELPADEYTSRVELGDGGGGAGVGATISGPIDPLEMSNSPIQSKGEGKSSAAVPMSLDGAVAGAGASEDGGMGTGTGTGTGTGQGLGQEKVPQITVQEPDVVALKRAQQEEEDAAAQAAAQQEAFACMDAAIF